MTRKKEVYKVQPLNENKRTIIAALIDEYGIETAGDIQTALRDLLGGTSKTMMEAEMNEHLGYKSYERSGGENYRNGTKTKKVRSSYGEFEIDVPQERSSSFAPQVVKKRQKDISNIDQKIISMYARGMTTRQISEQIEEIYGFECSEDFISDDRLTGESHYIDMDELPANAAMEIFHFDENTWVDDIENRALFTFVDSLSADSKRILFLMICGYTQLEIAGRMGISQSAISQRISVLEKRIKNFI